MRAAVLTDDLQLDVREVERPAPEPDQVLVEVDYCGICGSDVHFYEGMDLQPGADYPVVLGHEIAGHVCEVGGGVRDWNPGAAVIVNPYLPCGECDWCLEGRRRICPRVQTIGLHRPGGMAEYVTVPSGNLYSVPKGVNLAQAAIVPDAVSTPYHALIRQGAFEPGQTVVVYGSGGLSTHTVLLARRLGAGTVLAVARRSEAVQRLVETYGADDGIVLSDRTVQDVRERTGGEGAHLAVDFTGAPAVVKQAAAGLRVGGTLVIGGMQSQDVQLMSSVHFARFELSVNGAYTCNPRDMQTVLDLVASDRLDLSRSISEVVPMNAVDDGFRLVRDKVGDPVRVLVQP